MDSVFNLWYKGEAEGSLEFEEYCDDFLRWGTSGGAKKSVIGGSTYRTKWAWAYANSTNQDGSLREKAGLYNLSVSVASQNAQIALKEEAQKTREIITSPMPSYLRQSYLLYRWGKPVLNSPISDSKWIAMFEASSPKWYGCLDGDQFDYTIPTWFVLEVIDRLGSLDEHTRKVADEEIANLKQLKVEWRNRTWQWKAGVLSGWRMTSVLGTLASAAAARYIIRRAGKLGGIEYGAMGDDLVLYSYSEEVPPE